MLVLSPRVWYKSRRPVVPDPISLPLGCQYCGVRLTVDLFEWETETTLIKNVWPCPECGRENRVDLLGTVALVTRESEVENPA